jgi:hypothetical protein
MVTPHWSAMTSCKLGELTGTILNDQVGFFATRRGDGQVGLAAAFKIPRAA